MRARTPGTCIAAGGGGQERGGEKRNFYKRQKEKKKKKEKNVISVRDAGEGRLHGHGHTQRRSRAGRSAADGLVGCHKETSFCRNFIFHRHSEYFSLLCPFNIRRVRVRVYSVERV